MTRRHSQGVQPLAQDGHERSRHKTAGLLKTFFSHRLSLVFDVRPKQLFSSQCGPGTPEGPGSRLPHTRVQRPAGRARRQRAQLWTPRPGPRGGARGKQPSVRRHKRSLDAAALDEEEALGTRASGSELPRGISGRGVEELLRARTFLVHLSHSRLPRPAVPIRRGHRIAQPALETPPGTPHPSSAPRRGLEPAVSRWHHLEERPQAAQQRLRAVREASGAEAWPLTTAAAGKVRWPRRTEQLLRLERLTATDTQQTNSR
ncbi:uncharacterized protein LOC119049183 [Artibeus jamaicensis]|uniref:uncharacterized protein LOC119049183 n=1 Tax=Artibeus jamaicensis TaxID=9417 RepID=UPI00235AF899|nr:uncharacterized protein LOC119049183 [Artibeus jamaicensis]